MGTICGNTFHSKRVTSEQTGLKMARYQSWVCPIAKIISPTILVVHEIFALPCRLSLCGQPQWDWKEFHHQLPIPNPPSSLPLRGHPLFLLREPPPEPSAAPHTSHRMLGEPESHIAVTQASQVQSCDMAHYSPTDFDNTTTAALYVVSVMYTHFLGYYSD